MSNNNISFTSFNWRGSDCHGPPDVMLGFAQQTDSAIVDIILQDNDFEKCRYKQAIVSGEECCHSSLDSSLQYQSIGGSSSLIFPSVANGHEYCFMTSIAGNSTSAYLNGYFLDGDGCLEDKIKCNNGNLEIYPASGCNGKPEVFPLSASLASFTTTSAIQAFQAQKVTVSSGVSKYKWVTYFPQRLYAPLNNNAIEIFGTFLQVITLSASYATLMYYLYHLFKGTGKAIYKTFAFSHFLWLVYVSIDIYTQYLLTDNDNYLAIISTLSFDFKHLSTLVTVLISAHSLMTLVYVTTQQQKILAFVAISILNFALNGGEYLAYYQNDYPFLSDWALDTAVYFTVFMFVFDCLVTLLVTSKIVRAYAGRPLTLRESIALALQEINISYYVILQFTLVAVYYITFCAVRYTTLMGNDRGDSTMQYGVHNFLLSLHAIVTSVSYDNFAKLLQKMKDDSYEKKKKMLMEETTYNQKGYSPSSKGFGINLMPKSIMSHSEVYQSPVLGASFSSGGITRGNTTAKSGSSGRITDFGSLHYQSRTSSKKSTEKAYSSKSSEKSPLESYDIIESFANQRQRDSGRFNMNRFSVSSPSPQRFSVSSPQIRDSTNIQLARLSHAFSTSDFGPSSPT